MVNDKRQQWEVIKAEAPELAALMLEINKELGKPKIVSVELSSGFAFTNAVPVDGVIWDGRLRSCYGRR